MSLQRVDEIANAADDGPPNFTRGALVTGQLEVTGLLKNPGVAKAWVNYNHSGAAVRDSFNVSSVTDGGTGHFTPIWDTDFAAADYAVSFSYTNEVNNTHTVGFITSIAVGSASFSSYDVHASPNLTDKGQSHIQAFGTQ